MQAVICYEFLYHVRETRRDVRMTMAVEVDLVLTECGKMLGMELSALDTVTLSMVEELSQQLAGRLDVFLMPEEHENIPLRKGFISSDQFEGQLKHKIPEYSILFATQNGKVALCIDRSPAEKA